MAAQTTPETPPAPAAAPEPPGAFDYWETARRVGRYQWFGMRLFEVLGGWAATVPEPGVKLQFGSQAPHHAWHAELWQGLLPTAHEVRPEQFLVPPDDELTALVEALTAPTDAAHTIEKLAGVYRVVLPHLIATHTSHLERTSSVTDAPTARCLRLVLADELDDWRAGEMLLQSLIVSPADIDRARASQAGLEKLLLAAGGITGRRS